MFRRRYCRISFKRLLPHLVRCSFGSLKTRCTASDSAKKPFSTTPEWDALDSYVQSAIFALTMGAAAVVLSTILWTLSVPWVVWCLWRLVLPAVS